ncbi:MAG TPA: hypothetical protein VF776_08360 [Sphingomicrobium sp.]
MIRAPFICSAFMLVVTACGPRSPVDEKAGDTAGLSVANISAPSAMGEPHAATTPALASASPAATLPAALQGRWALSPTDCTSALSDAKGLMVINPNELRFYESRAVPSEVVAASPSSISGTFVFTGKGQSWAKYESLKIDKNVLVRTEAKPTASFSYAKCG